MAAVNSYGKRRHNWRSLSLRTLIFLLTIVGLACGLVGRRIRIQGDQSRAVKALREIGAKYLGTAQIGFEDPWAASRYGFMRGKFTRATELDMRATDANPQEYVMAITKLPFLKRLYLGDCRVTDDVVDAIARCRDLRRLELRANPLVSNNSVDALMRLKRLNALNVRATGMTWYAFSQLATLPEMQRLSFDHVFSNGDLEDLAGIGRVCFDKLNCRAVDAAGLRNLVGLEGISDVWLLEADRCRVTPDWQLILEELQFKRLSLTRCSFAPGLFDTYDLPCADGKQKGRIVITASQREFEKVASRIRTAGSLRIEESPYWQRRHDNMLVTINEPNERELQVKFDVIAPGDIALEENADDERDSEAKDAPLLVSIAALNSMEGFEELWVDSERLFAQVNPELVCSAKRITLFDTNPYSKASYAKSLNEISQGQTMATKWLTIDSPNLVDEDFRVIARMTELESLAVSSPKLDASGFAHLAALQKLKVLRFDHECDSIEALSVDELVTLLQPLSNLKSLTGPSGWRTSKLDELNRKLGVSGQP